MKLHCIPCARLAVTTLIKADKALLHHWRHIGLDGRNKWVAGVSEGTESPEDCVKRFAEWVAE